MSTSKKDAPYAPFLQPQIIARHCTGLIATSAVATSIHHIGFFSFFSFFQHLQTSSPLLNSRLPMNHNRINVLLVVAKTEADYYNLLSRSMPAG
jgi:hypothetical protein